MSIQPLTPEIIEKRRVLRRRIVGIPGRIWRKTRRGLLWTLAIAFVLHSALNIYTSVLLNRELSAIRQKGEPLQFSELAPPEVPDSQNAALVYKEAFDSLRFSDEEKGSFPTLEGNSSPQQNRWIEAAVRKNQKAIELTRRAASMTQCRFPLNYGAGNPLALQFPHYREIRDLARLLAAQVNLDTKNGDFNAAVRDVRALFGITHHLSNEPVLIGFLVAQAIDKIANRALAQVLTSAPITATQVRAFQNSLPKTDWNRAFRHILMGERAWSLFAFEIVGGSSRGKDSLDDSERGFPIWASYPLVIIWRPVLKLDEVQMLRLWRQQIVDSPLYHQVPRPLGLNESLEKTLERVPRYAILTRIFFPVYPRAGDHRDFAEVRHRQREIALVLTVFRTARDHYPAQLTEIAGLSQKSLPLDPYSNKPFIYRRESQGFTLYSIGVNRKDDGGASYSSAGTNWNNVDEDDIIWGSSKPQPNK